MDNKITITIIWVMSICFCYPNITGFFFEFCYDINISTNQTWLWHSLTISRLTTDCLSYVDYNCQYIWYQYRIYFVRGRIQLCSYNHNFPSNVKVAIYLFKELCIIKYFFVYLLKGNRGKQWEVNVYLTSNIATRRSITKFTIHL